MQNRNSFVTPVQILKVNTIIYCLSSNHFKGLNEEYNKIKRRLQKQFCPIALCD